MWGLLRLAPIIGSAAIRLGTRVVEPSGHNQFHMSGHNLMRNRLVTTLVSGSNPPRIAARIDTVEL